MERHTFEQSVLASLSALQHTANSLSAAVETLDLKLSELLDANLDSAQTFGSLIPLAAKVSAVASVPAQPLTHHHAQQQLHQHAQQHHQLQQHVQQQQQPGQVRSKATAAAVAVAGGAGGRGSQMQQQHHQQQQQQQDVIKHERKSLGGDSKDNDKRQRGSKLLFSALKQILYTIPSQYEHVDSVYDEIKSFVAANLIVSPDITPTNIMAENLMPYLRTAHGLDPSLRDMIWRHMSGVTGCMSLDTRRTLKRMIDNHYRGFKRKPATRDQIPTSMLPLLDVLKANAKHDGRMANGTLEKPMAKRPRV